MKHILFFLFTASLVLLACSSVKKTDSSLITQGITGQVTEQTGNRMPMKDAMPETPKGVVTTVLIYEPTHISQVSREGTAPVYTAIHTKLVASIDTDSTGSFTVALPVGNYSLFVKQGKNFYANLFDTNNNIALFAVEEGKLTQAKLSVSNRASF
jgi:hypothetical protein